MAYDDLRDWIKTLEKNGELKRISEEVSPELEITEITDRVSKIGGASRDYAPGGPALLFENVKGHPGHKVLDQPVWQRAADGAWRWAWSGWMRSPSASRG